MSHTPYFVTSSSTSLFSVFAFPSAAFPLEEFVAQHRLKLLDMKEVRVAAAAKHSST